MSTMILKNAINDYDYNQVLDQFDRDNTTFKMKCLDKVYIIQPTYPIARWSTVCVTMPLSRDRVFASVHRRMATRRVR